MVQWPRSIAATTCRLPVCCVVPAWRTCMVMCCPSRPLRGDVHVDRLHRHINQNAFMLVHELGRHTLSCFTDRKQCRGKFSLRTVWDWENKINLFPDWCTLTSSAVSRDSWLHLPRYAAQISVTAWQVVCLSHCLCRWGTTYSSA